MEPQQFRKKPVVIEAMQINTLDYDGLCDILKWSGANPSDEGSAVMYISTLEGQMDACNGDWIIKGVAGEFYPCKPEIFSATYEAV